MRKVSAVVSLGLLIGLAIPAAAQPGRGDQNQFMDPVEVLLELRRELDLSREQIVHLRGIQARLEERNRPLLAELLTIQRQVRAEFVTASGDSGRPSRRFVPTEAQMEAARVPMRKIQENNVAAMEEINALLTQEQKQRAAAILRIQRRRFERLPDWFRFPG